MVVSGRQWFLQPVVFRLVSSLRRYLDFGAKSEDPVMWQRQLPLEMQLPTYCLMIFSQSMGGTTSRVAVIRLQSNDNIENIGIRVFPSIPWETKKSNNRHHERLA